MAGLIDILQKLVPSIFAKESAKQEIVSGGKVSVDPRARTYISPSDTYDSDIGYDSGLDTHSPGARRRMWYVAEQQNAHIPSTVLTSSGQTKSNVLAAIQGGIGQNPIAATTWSAMPSMQINMRTTGPVMVVANASVKSSAVSDTVAFAIYRDGLLIGNHVTHTLPSTASTSALIQLTAMDNPPVGNHLYALYWSPGTGTLVATSNQRNLYAINLMPQ